MKNLRRAIQIFVTVTSLLIASNAGAQSVTIGAITGSQFCSGDTIAVPFTATGSWGAGNVFTLQISDPTGGFSNGFQNAGTLFDTKPGTFTIKTIASGSSAHYRFRILASNPPFTSADNGSDIAIGTRPGFFSFYTDLPAGSIGMPMTFTAETGDLNDTGDLQDNAFWDFGPGATPETATTVATNFDGAARFSESVTYSTPGDKTVTLTIVKPGGCSGSTLTNKLHIFDCSIPTIPHDAIVVNSSATVVEGHKTYWVNPGFNLDLPNDDLRDTIFAEPGSTISDYAGFNCVMYLKQGAVLNSAKASGNSLIFGDGASINTNTNSDFTLNCPTLDFDYSNAPPNPAHPSSSVKDNLNAVSLSVSPNPTSGMISVQGLPSDNITVSVSNILGETVLAQKNPSSPDFTLDLSKLVAGTYYVRFSSASSVVTKAIIKN